MRFLPQILVAFLPAAVAGAQEPAPATKPAVEVFRVRHILIQWKGNPFAPPTVTRDKEAARKYAEEILAKLKEGADFAALAAEVSDGPTKVFGGDLGQFAPGQLDPALEKAALALAPGKVGGPIETRFGFHVIERLAVEKPWPEIFALSHILFAYKGALRASPEITRTKEEARAAAEKVLAEISTGKIGFDEAAKKYSDDKVSGRNGGSLGTLEPRRLAPPIVDAVAKLAIGETSGVVETPFGFHLLRRDKADVPYRASHILIPWKGCQAAPKDVTRSREEAKKLAEEILAQLKQGGDFAELAHRYSTCPSKAQGGDLGFFRKGQMVPAFEKAVEGAKVGSIVGPVETPFGWHVIKRTQ